MRGRYNSIRMVRALAVAIAATFAIVQGGSAQSEVFRLTSNASRSVQFEVWRGEAGVFDEIQAGSSAPLLQLMQHMISSGIINRNQPWSGRQYEGSGIIYRGQQEGGRWVFDYNFDVIPRDRPEYRLRVLGNVCASDANGTSLQYCARRDRLMYGPKQLTNNYNALVEDALYRMTLYWQPRYVYDRGSLEEVQLVAKDQQGRPSELRGRASFGNRSYRQEFRLMLSGGQPACIDIGWSSNCRAVPTITDERQIIAAREQREREEAAQRTRSREQAEAQRVKNLGPCLRDDGIGSPDVTVEIVNGYGDFQRLETRPGAPRQYYSNICTRPVRYTLSCLGLQREETAAPRSRFDTPPILCSVTAKP